MESRRYGRGIVTALVALALVGWLAIAPNPATAQDMATPAAGEHNHPVHIHTGACDAVGEVIFPLENVVSVHDQATPEAVAMASPAADEDAEYVAESTTTITGSLDDLLAESHVINVHESEENIGTYIACGVITGTPEKGELSVTLTSVNESGWDGEAVLTDNGDGTIDVTVRLKAADVESMASPVASPTS